MKGNNDHPQILGDKCAQELYSQPLLTDNLLRIVGDQTVEYYTPRHRDPNSPAQKRVEAIFRITSAVLLHGVEVELAEDMRRLGDQGKEFSELAAEISSAQQDLHYIDTMTQPYEKKDEKFFTEEQWDFLRISSLFSLDAARRFLHGVLFEPGHWARPVFEAYRKNLPDYKLLNDKFVLHEYDPDVPEGQAYMHICGNAINSNVTALDVITAATRHGHHRLWQQDADPGMALLAKVKELAWPDSISKRFFETMFKNSDPRLGCPYSHDSVQIATNGIYRLPSLRNGRLRIRGKCPASIELSSPHHDGYQNISAAQLRLTTVIPIAAETLWKTKD
ncbi:MAG TPA: hypothetical protein VFB59_05325 [Candidatus Saccharimonadales bacterium]|nr:hypothetical protein [Candidatus Saccharimonadales bacterium]